MVLLTLARLHQPMQGVLLFRVGNDLHDFDHDDVEVLVPKG